ncbi:hypothetical protein QJS10_CPB20g00477 [Acorus calamus]|uniref:Neprosin activation peptide domain-containing protein n=1 Tax=Acorus calamus TaxID=4465 RepID=A0AAV9CCA1_ACOCL|nr:hypothetical protein QJS10_CPB20g00477 [Acorus calamus]
MKVSTFTKLQSVDGDIIDCIDIYRQSAFDHPLRYNHTIQHAIVSTKQDKYSGGKADLHL